jgi:hypothetical protein
MQTPGVIPLDVGGVLIEPGGLADVLGQIFRDVADVPTSLLGTAQIPLTCTCAPNRTT